MLGAEEPTNNWLCQGRGWADIPTWKTSKGSRLEKVTARLCGFGVSTVLKARTCSSSGTFLAALVRGRKRRAVGEEDLGDEDGAEDAEQKGAAALWPGGVSEASLQPTPLLRSLNSVRARYLPQAALNPNEHAIAVTLGRLMVWATVNATPYRALAGLMTQITLANVQLGEKYQSKSAMSLFTGIAAHVCQKLTRFRFHDVAPNLPFPSAFRLIWDGITLRNGATVLPIIVVFTSHTGRIASEILDVPISQGSSGVTVASTVLKVLDKVLGIRESALYLGKAGLPLHATGGSEALLQAAAANGSQASVQAALGRAGKRTDVLTSMVVDRAYSGTTGNKADQELRKLLGISQLGLGRYSPLLHRRGI